MGDAQQEREIVRLDKTHTHAAVAGGEQSTPAEALDAPRYVALALPSPVNLHYPSRI